MFFTTIKLSKNQSKTPEGFLICHGCAIARTGVQTYNEMEIDVEPGPDGIIQVMRTPEEVFSPETIASAEGKDIVHNHPGGDVVPENWRYLTHGHMQNVRRGDGVEDHLLIADLVFKSPESIAMIESNPEHELSCGYGSKYEIYGPGRAAQIGIRINHVALVREGRCGPACRTRDSAMIDLVASTQHSVADEQRGTHATCEKESGKMCTCGVATTNDSKDSGMRFKDWIKRMHDAITRDDKGAVRQMMDDAASIMEMTGDPGAAELDHHIHLHIEPTKPAGGLPGTGETTVAKDDAGHAQVGGEHAATFGGKTFFADAALNDAFHGEMKGMKDAIDGMGKKMADGFEEMKKHFEKKTEDKVAGEESAHEEKNKAILGELKEEAPAKATGDDGALVKARDSAMLVDSFAQTKCDAEILAPGVTIPTFDSAMATADGYSALCNLRKAALTQFAQTEDGKQVLSQLTRTMDFAGCQCREVTQIFRGAVAVQKTRNSTAQMRGFTNDEAKAGAGAGDGQKPFTVGTWQELIDKHNAENGVTAD